MYRRLIGPYPYKKFALVENFWDTGYGMPSFTLLGSKIIRFPFILHSSYPHEILHNWWGNGVFVDYKQGNWSEGLTAYLADHLIKEQRGAAHEYRRAALQNYTNYVSVEKDFPLNEFRSRHSSVTEAVGYGKTMMFFHMLRENMGDELFIRGLRKFFKDNLFRRAAFKDLQEAFNTVSGKDMTTEFEQWTERSGAPDIRITGGEVTADGDKYILSANLYQVQEGPAYTINVPIAVSLLGRGEAYQTRVPMNSKHLAFNLELPAPPVRVDVDPQYDLFRRLDKNEIPPALSQAFGRDKVLIILPAGADKKMLQAYRQLGQLWQDSRTGRIELKLDTEVDSLPKEGAVWVFGWENGFLPDIKSALSDYEITLSNSGIKINKTEFKRDNHSFTLTANQPANPDVSMAFIATDTVNSIPGLGRKLPHYGKYSYLVFEGDEPANVLKGAWPVINSPLSVILPSLKSDTIHVKSAGLSDREPLISLPEEYSEERIQKSIEIISNPDMKGRGPGLMAQR